MDRRTFLKTTTAAAAASTATAGAVHAAEQQAPEPAAASVSGTQSHSELTVALPATQRLRDAAHVLLRDIEIASAGRLRFRFSKPAGPVQHALQAGEADGAFGLLAEICDAPGLALFSGAAGNIALTPDNLLTWHESGGGRLFLDEALSEQGLHAVIAGHSGRQTGLWANAEIHTLADVAQAKIDTVGLGREIIAQIQKVHGISTIGTQPTHLIEAPISPMDALLDLPPANQKIWYQEGIHNEGHAYALVFSQSSWTGLAPSDRLLINALATAATHNALAHAKTTRHLVAPSLFAARQIERQLLPADVALALGHTAIECTYKAMANSPTLARAFDAYGSFYKAVMGQALPTPRDHSVPPTA